MDMLKTPSGGSASAGGHIFLLQQPIMGNFFLCGLGKEDFADLPDALAEKYRERFWMPELILGGAGGVAVIPLDDGTRPE